MHRAVGLGEDQLARGFPKRRFQARPELGGDGHGEGLAVLGARCVPGPADHDDAGGQVDVLLAKPEDLALAHHGIEAGGDRALPLLRYLIEDGLPLIPWPGSSSASAPP